MALERHLFIPDPHIPFEDEEAWAALMHFIPDYRPDLTAILGDWWDLGPLSKYAQDPRYAKTVEEQRTKSRLRLGELRFAVGPEGRIVFLKGNHEHRIDNYLMRNNPQLLLLKSESGLDLLSTENLLGLSDFDIDFYDERESLALPCGYIAEHGDRVSSESGATARAMVAARGCSVIHGHTHRLGQYFKTTRAGTVHGIECGTLADHRHPGMAWAGKDPNWQTGFAIAEWLPDSGLYQVTIVPIVDGGFVWNGMLYTPNGAEEV